MKTVIIMIMNRKIYELNIKTLKILNFYRLFYCIFLSFTFQVSVTIIECKQLSGANINPYIEVRVGDRVKRTEAKMSTNEPYYNQVCNAYLGLHFVI